MFVKRSAAAGSSWTFDEAERLASQDQSLPRDTHVSQLFWPDG